MTLLLFYYLNLKFFCHKHCHRLKVNASSGSSFELSASFVALSVFVV